MKKAIWISFDLGVRGDYEGMYEFLDNNNALECGDSVAFVSYEFRNDLIGELAKEVKGAVKFDKRSRVYVIFPNEKGKYAGRFIVGKRKRPVWTGYGSAEQEEEDTGE